MRERVVRFGERALLTGVLTEPEGATRDVGLIILNAGLVHRVGPNRIGVQLARRMAGSGFVALRFDFSNLGDSGPNGQPLGPEASAVADIRAAIDELGRSHGLEHVVLFGICSGAENALRAALDDGRVVGAAMVDGYAYRTPAYYLYHFGPRLVRLASWRRLLLERNPLGRWFNRKAGWGSSGGAPEPPRRRYPARRLVGAFLKALVDRRVELLLLYTGGGMADYYSYEGQFFDSFPSLRGNPSIQVVFLPAADHLFTRAASREALVNILERWGDRFAWRQRDERVLLII